MLSETILPLRGPRGPRTSNSTTLLGDEIDPLSTDSSSPSNILETEADDCVAATMPEGGTTRDIPQHRSQLR